MLLSLAIVLAVVILYVIRIIIPDTPEKFEEWWARRPRFWG